ncbi:MAG TPA: hypothetical protein VKA08_09625, partial [Balneolales bacterium]|nr:hypothetical protein [Balneolales bacterium]
LNNPQLHKIFGIREQPGLVESLSNQSIWLTQTRIEQLFVLPAGNWENHTLGLKDLAALRDVFYSLEREFEFVIVDMGSILPIDNFPALFANEVDGLMLVVDTRKTKKADIDEIFHYIDDKQIFGFVLNRMKDGHHSKGWRRKK